MTLDPLNVKNFVVRPPWIFAGFWGEHRTVSLGEIRRIERISGAAGGAGWLDGGAACGQVLAPCGETGEDLQDADPPFATGLQTALKDRLKPELQTGVESNSDGSQSRLQAEQILMLLAGTVTVVVARMDTRHAKRDPNMRRMFDEPRFPFIVGVLPRKLMPSKDGAPIPIDPFSATPRGRSRRARRLGRRWRRL
jgi:hypothetical protein